MLFPKPSYVCSGLYYWSCCFFVCLFYFLFLIPIFACMENFLWLSTSQLSKIILPSEVILVFAPKALLAYCEQRACAHMSTRYFLCCVVIVRIYPPNSSCASVIFLYVPWGQDYIYFNLLDTITMPYSNKVPNKSLCMNKILQIFFPAIGLMHPLRKSFNSRA